MNTSQGRTDRAKDEHDISVKVIKVVRVNINEGDVVDVHRIEKYRQPTNEENDNIKPNIH